MGIKYKGELEIEKELIQQLVTGGYKGIPQWTYREDLKTEDQLWENFKSKLENNNLNSLQGVMLTETEFRQIKNQLSFPSTR